jgi:hypothetical protein
MLVEVGMIEMFDARGRVASSALGITVTLPL